MNLAYHETNPVPSLHSPFENPKSHDLCCLLGVLEALPGSGEWWQTGLDDGPESRDAAHPILIPFSDPAEWADMLIRATGADEFLGRREEVKSWLSIQLLLPLILSGVYPPVSTPVTTDPAYSPLDLPLTGPAPAATWQCLPLSSPSHWDPPFHYQPFTPMANPCPALHYVGDSQNVGRKIPRRPAERGFGVWTSQQHSDIHVTRNNTTSWYEWRHIARV